MVESVEQLNSGDPVTIEAEIPAVEPTPDIVESLDTPDLPVIESSELPSVEVSTTTVETEPPAPVNKRAFPVKKVLAGVALVTLLVWAIRQLIPTKKPTEQGEPANAG
ncbi:hypothetical protein VEJY3_07470 [Vibrio sp. EJY3]|nr:hypothetical protein VEJY3_07470 [Vibrio sp. EJY3]